MSFDTSASSTLLLQRSTNNSSGEANVLTKNIIGDDRLIPETFFTGRLNTGTLPVDPFVTGYAFWYWTKLPKWLLDKHPNFKLFTEKNMKSFNGLDDITLNTVGVAQGFSAEEHQYAGGISLDNGFSVSVNEFSGLPITRGIEYWVTGIRDVATNTALYPLLGDYEYGAKNHTGEGIYIVTRPDAFNVDNKNIVEYAAYYTNIIPDKIPHAHLAYTGGENSANPIDLTYKATRHIGEGVISYAHIILNTAIKERIKNYISMNQFDPNNTTHARATATGENNAGGTTSS